MLRDAVHRSDARGEGLLRHRVPRPHCHRSGRAGGGRDAMRSTGLLKPPLRTRGGRALVLRRVPGRARMAVDGVAGLRRRHRILPSPPGRGAGGEGAAMVRSPHPKPLSRGERGFFRVRTIQVAVMGRTTGRSQGDGRSFGIEGPDRGPDEPFVTTSEEPCTPAKADSFSCAPERPGKRNPLMQKFFFGSREFRAKETSMEVTP